MRAVLLLLLLGAVPAAAQVESASVRVDGMSCPFCAFGVEKRLKKVEGVENIEIHMDCGLAVLTAADGASIALERIPEAIRKAGFTPGKIAATAAGTVDAGADGRLMLRWGERSLEIDVPKDLREQMLTDARIRVRGILTLSDDRIVLQAKEIEK